MSKKITIRQLTDKEDNPIAPYTPAAAVYLPNGTNIETQIGGMDINAIEGKQASALQEINDTAALAMARIDSEQAEDRAAIARLECGMDNIDKNLMPLKIEYSIVPNDTMTSCDITFTVKEYEGSIPTLSSMVITKSTNNGPAKTIFNGTSYTGTISNSIEGGLETYTFTAKTTDKTSTVSSSIYLCFYASSPEGEIENVDICNFSKVITTDGRFTFDLATERGEYIWLLIPSVLNISEATHQSIAITTNAPEMVEVDIYGYFRAYRSINDLDDAQWHISVH